MIIIRWRAATKKVCVGPTADESSPSLCRRPKSGHKKTPHRRSGEGDSYGRVLLDHSRPFQDTEQGADRIAVRDRDVLKRAKRFDRGAQNVVSSRTCKRVDRN